MNIQELKTKSSEQLINQAEELGIENPFLAQMTNISVTMDNNYSILANVEELE